MNSQSPRVPLSQSIGYQLAMLVLSFYAVGALLLDLLVQLPPHASAVIQHFDFVVCVIFLLDFVIQLWQAPDKLGYLKVGWIDLLASIPAADVLQWGRFARILRIFRVLRAIRGTRKLLQHVCSTGGSAGSSAAVGLILLLAFSSISILIVEDPGTANIKTAEQAIWWSFTTITTVGYGDYFPTSTEGRVVAVILMISGVGLLGALTAFIASRLLIDNHPTRKETDVTVEIAILHQKLDSLNSSLAALRTAVDHLREKK